MRGNMILGAFAVLALAGCIKLPTPEQRARLGELQRGAAELTAELDAAAAEIRTVMHGHAPVLADSPGIKAASAYQDDNGTHAVSAK